MGLLKWLSNVSPFRGMPVDDTGSSASVTAQTGETIQMYYNNAGTLTADAGQAAGTVVMAKTTYNNILNNLGDSVGKKGDTSLSFTSTALTTEVGIGTVDPQFVESLDEASWSVRMAAIGAKLANGEFYVDFAKGVLYGKKASTQSTLTNAAYKYHAAAAGTVSGDITKVGGVSVPTSGADTVSNTRSDIPTSARLSGYNGSTWDRLKAGITAATATFTGFLNALPWAVYNATAPTKTDGQGNPLQSDSLGNLQVNSYTAIFGEDPTNNAVMVYSKPIATSDNAITRDVSAALEASTVTKASAGRFYGLFGRIDKTAGSGDKWILVLNASSLPADGAVTVLTSFKKVHVNGTDTFIDLDLQRYGIYASTGIVVVLSTTEFTKTIDGAYLSTTVLYS